jgi:SARP family transcriptional regulator, regulator of embCAB operon
MGRGIGLSETAERRTQPAATVLLLGRVELRNAAGSQPVGGAKLRLILAHLALAEGRVVSAEQLIDALWGANPSANARNTLHYHVGVLRKALAAAGAPDALVTLPPGYAVRLPTDLTAFAGLRQAGNDAVRLGRADEAADAYAEALRCWRGPALADLREFTFAEERAVALDAQRMTCLEAWCDAELERGHADALVAQLQGLVVEHPTRERLWEQLMLALYRSGRQVDALAAYRRARATLDRELGVEPSERLQGMHVAILKRDPQLAAPQPGTGQVVSTIRTRLSAAEPARAAALTGSRGLRVELDGARVVLGRHSGCDVVLADEEASRTHAEVVQTAAGHAIVDLGSTNGTFRNGVRVSGPTDLVHGDRVEIGHLVLRYEGAVD